MTNSKRIGFSLINAALATTLALAGLAVSVRAQTPTSVNSLAQKLAQQIDVTDLNKQAQKISTADHADSLKQDDDHELNGGGSSSGPKGGGGSSVASTLLKAQSVLVVESLALNKTVSLIVVETIKANNGMALSSDVFKTKQ